MSILNSEIMNSPTICIYSKSFFLTTKIIVMSHGLMLSRIHFFKSPSTCVQIFFMSSRLLSTMDRKLD